jgi:hypothetical protein
LRAGEEEERAERWFFGEEGEEGILISSVGGRL